ncbi:MAG: hypothetical protein MJE77_11615 [Proteobacteria bacterium]|nr:hypothetical protein [Pseudomonadota bacterium]
MKSSASQQIEPSASAPAQPSPGESAASSSELPASESPASEPAASSPSAILERSTGENKEEQSRNLDAEQRKRLSLVVISLLLSWTFLYNLFAKGMSPGVAFIEILNTISDDFILGSLLTVGLGVGILIVFTATKLYTQIISNVYSFRMLEDLFVQTMRQGKFKEFFQGLLKFEHLPQPTTIYPDQPIFMLFAFSLIYAMSWIYVVLFSEALFFVSWSAGVDLPVTYENLLLLPLLALAIPFSARVMAYARYPYAQDYADFMPGALFVLLMVAALGFLFKSPDQEFFLLRVYNNLDFRNTFLRNGLCLAFIPVFSEALFWLFSVSGFKKIKGADDA